MQLNECQKDLVKYILDYEKGIVSLTPCIEVFQYIFLEKYSNLEIEESARELVSSEVLSPYSFHAYFRLTETFKSSIDYNLYKD